MLVGPLVGLVVAAGCSDDGGGIALRDPSAPSADSTMSGAPAGDTPATAAGGEALPPAPCDDLTWALSAMTATVSGVELPAEARTRIDSTADKLPADVRADYETMSAAYAAFGDEGAGDTGIGSPGFEVAANRITTYLATNCPAADG